MRLQGQWPAPGSWHQYPMGNRFVPDDVTRRMRRYLLTLYVLIGSLYVVLVFLLYICIDGLGMKFGNDAFPETALIKWILARRDVSIAATNGVHLAKESSESLVPLREIRLNGTYHETSRPMVYDPKNEFLYVSGTIRAGKTEIHRIHLPTEKQETLTISESNESGKMEGNILGIEHDYVRNVLYWTNGHGGKIMKVELNVNPLEQTILYHTDIPQMSTSGLALDECNRTLYWTSYVLPEGTGFIESLNLNDREHTKLHHSDIHCPTDIAIDQVERKLYWCDMRAGYAYRIERSNLDGSSREVIIKGDAVEPISLALTAQYVYWINYHTGKFERTMKTTNNTRQDKILDYDVDKPRSLVSYKKVLQCALNDIEHEITSETIRSSTSSEIKTNKEKDTGRTKYTIIPNIGTCLNGGTPENNNRSNLQEDIKCRCPPNFHGKFCEKCDYCVNGKCTIGSNKSVTCTCDRGYNGSRCERDICFNYCLNGGQCNIGNQSEPTCDCKTTAGNYHGSRCEIDCNLFCQNNPASGIYDSGKPVCACVRGLYVANVNMENVTVSQLSEEKHTNMEMHLRFGLIGVGVLCVLFLIAIICLIKSVYKLRKRPRIKKRIIVNKNVTPTPLTCRPSPVGEQCEITIENCCNMNICETPCYEPQLRTSDKSVSKIEEKKNLLGNMEEGESGSPSQDTLY